MRNPLGYIYIAVFSLVFLVSCELEQVEQYSGDINSSTIHQPEFQNVCNANQAHNRMNNPHYQAVMLVSVNNPGIMEEVAEGLQACEAMEYHKFVDENTYSATQIYQVVLNPDVKPDLYIHSLQKYPGVHNVEFDQYYDVPVEESENAAAQEANAGEPSRSLATEPSYSLGI